MIPIVLSLLCVAPSLASQEVGVCFERRQLSNVFYSEGANFGDLDGDGDVDVVSGPFWYEGPDFTVAHALHGAVAADPLGYSDDFFAWVHDVDSDGWNDVFKVGFPGQDAFWFQNPGAAGGAWTRHIAFEGVDNESPLLVDLVGDAALELVCNHGGAFGYLTADSERPTAAWSFHPISADLNRGRFTHGLGVGDLDGDGRADVLHAGGWFAQPAALDGDPTWRHHEFPFTTRGGGAQMLVLDVDDDGDSDLVTSLAAHAFGLSWYEQTGKEASGAITFREHRIMDRAREANPFGVRFSAPHALALCDVDGDGVQDLVTGKRHWSHGPDGDPEPKGPSVLYWFRLERRPDGARFVPHLIDDGSGVGTQVACGDVNGDGRADVVVGNKAGTFLFLQSPDGVDVTPPPAYVPPAPEPSRNVRDGALPARADGSPLDLGFESGDLSGWTATGDAFEGQPIRGDTSGPRCGAPSEHVGEFWMGGYELHGDGRTGTLTSDPFVVTAPWASFLIAGGDHVGTSVELLEDDGAPFYRIAGESYESLKIAVVDLRERVGESIRVRLVDDVEGGWGHLNYDDFRFHDAEPDFAPELCTLPRDEVEHAGLTPEQAARAMTVPDGFHVDLIAAEPDLHQPIALAIDHKGRLWVAEAHSYPIRRAEGEGLDQILVFEDADHDGSFETRTVFLEGLNLVSGLEVGHGGVWIGAAPYLMFVPDADDDLVPDATPEIVLDGWGYEDTHETLNAFTWGPDGWLYGCHGVFTYSNVGAPGTPDDERVPINAGVWRFHPKRRAFEVFAWGTSNPWGIDFDLRGQAFVTACVIPHLFHVIQGARYIRQSGDHYNRFAYEELDTIADHRHWQGASPWAGNNRSGDLGGGHAHCGALIYHGDAFPEEYRGRLFMNNVHGNRINADVLEREGSGYVGRHAEDLLLANDAWFRGINLKTGPDGAVYFIDWSDPQACHWAEPEVWDRTNGRLYRLRYGDVAPVAVDLRAEGNQELIALSLNGEEWSSRGARLELSHREDVGIGIQHGLTVVDPSATPERLLRALWTLNATGPLNEAVLATLIEGDREELAAWAVQLACGSEGPSETVGSEFRAQLGTPSRALLGVLRTQARRAESPVVRLALASALQRMGPDFDWLEGLLAHDDSGDGNITNVLWYALEAHVTADPLRALTLVEHAANRTLAGHAARRAAAEEATRSAVVQAMTLAGTDAWRHELLFELDAALRDARGLTAPAGWGVLYPGFAASDDADVRDAALWVAAAFADEAAVPRLAQILIDEGEEPERRARALEALVAAGTPAAAPALRSVLGESNLRGAAIRGLAVADDPATPPALLALYPELEPDERADAIATLASREPFALALLDAVDAGIVAPTELTAFTLRQLGAFGSEAVDARVAAVWGVFRATDEQRAQRIAELVARFAVDDHATTRPANGRAVFERTCARCHELFGEGGTLGPGLTGSNRVDLDYLLTNLIDPNAVIGRDYQTTMVRTNDGLFATGVLTSETETSITLTTETDEVVIARADIEERVLSDVSIMPEGQLDTLAEADQRDLVAYLRGAAQVSPPVSELDGITLFDGATLTGWSGDPAVWSVEDGELVGRTADGLAHNDFLVSDHELADFRLEVEVRLVGGAGNSGIQFRSRALEGGDVAGYQADIGAGWWGKLYEEHGRGVLSDVSGEAHVVADGWNTYVIEARGSRLRTWINGELCTYLDDPPGARSGRLAPQIHSGGPTEIRLRNLRLSPPRSEPE